MSIEDGWEIIRFLLVFFFFYSQLSSFLLFWPPLSLFFLLLPLSLYPYFSDSSSSLCLCSRRLCSLRFFPKRYGCSAQELPRRRMTLISTRRQVCDNYTTPESSCAHVGFCSSLSSIFLPSLSLSTVLSSPPLSSFLPPPSLCSPLCFLSLFSWKVASIKRWWRRQRRLQGCVWTIPQITRFWASRLAYLQKLRRWAKGLASRSIHTHTHTHPHTRTHTFTHIFTHAPQTKDMHRTFPENPKFRHPDMLEKMQRVLLAYARRNKAVGYCQVLKICVLVSAWGCWFLPVRSASYLSGFYPVRVVVSHPYRGLVARTSIIILWYSSHHLRFTNFSFPPQHEHKHKNQRNTNTNTQHKQTQT